MVHVCFDFQSTKIAAFRVSALGEDWLGMRSNRLWRLIENVEGTTYTHHKYQNYHEIPWNIGSGSMTTQSTDNDRSTKANVQAGWPTCLLRAGAFKEVAWADLVLGCFEGIVLESRSLRKKGGDWVCWGRERSKWRTSESRVFCAPRQIIFSFV